MIRVHSSIDSLLAEGIRKRVDDLLGFCSDKVDDYKFNIIWDPPKQAEGTDAIRQGGGHGSSVASNAGANGAVSAAKSISDDLCQVKSINDLCQPLMVNSKFNPSWSNVNKRAWCQQATGYFRCLKSRLDKCLQPDVQTQFQTVERYLHSQININCPGGVDGCTRHSTDARCKIGLSQSNGCSSTYSLTNVVLQSVLSMLLLLLAM